MSGRPLADIAALLLGAARAHGATAADVVVSEGDSLRVGVRLGGIEKIERSRGKHLGLRAFAGERSAILSTSDFSTDGLERLAADAVALARVTAADPASGLPSAEDLATEFPDLDLDDPSVARVTSEHAVEWCREAEAAALDADPRITNSEGAEFGGGGYEVVYAATNGFAGSYRSSSCSLSVVPVAAHDGSMQRDHWYSAKRHLAELDKPAAIGRRAAERALRRLGARPVATCEVPVVFDPEMAASLMHHVASAVSGSSLYRRMSFLLGRLGERIAPPSVSVYDDGTLRRGLASKPFDAEGLATRRTAVIRDGVLESYLLDCYSARKLGARSTGSAARGVADSPHASPTNLFLAAGSTSAEDIIASVRSGLYVTELMGFGVNQVTGDYSRGASGLWIENGALAYPVEEVTIAGNLLQMLLDIEAVGDDLELRHGISAPTVKIARLTVAGQ